MEVTNRKNLDIVLGINYYEIAGSKYILLSKHLIPLIANMLITCVNYDIIHMHYKQEDLSS